MFLSPKVAPVVTVVGGTPAPLSDLVRRGSLVPTTPTEAWPRVVGFASAALVNQVSVLPPPFVAATDAGPMPRLANAVEHALCAAEWFIGVPVSTAVWALSREGRCLPLAVWLRIADVLLDALSSLEASHGIWASWPGPHCIGARFDGRLVVSAGAMGNPLPAWWSVERESDALDADWRSAQTLVNPRVALVDRTRRALVWMLSPWPLSFQHQPSGPWDGKWAHLEMTPAVAEVLTVLPGPETLGSVAALRDALRACWPSCEPASEAAACAALLGASPRTLLDEASACESLAAALPPAWRNRGLAVLVDEALGEAPTLDRFPAVAGATRLIAGVPARPTRWLRARVTVDQKPHAALRVGADAQRLVLPLPAKSALVAGQRVLVRLEHPIQTGAAVELWGTAAAAELRLDEPSPADGAVLDALLAEVKPSERGRPPPPVGSAVYQTALLRPPRSQPNPMQVAEHWVQAGPDADDWRYVGPLRWSNVFAIVALPVTLPLMVLFGLYSGARWLVRRLLAGPG